MNVKRHRDESTDLCSACMARAVQTRQHEWALQAISDGHSDAEILKRSTLNQHRLNILRLVADVPNPGSRAPRARLDAVALSRALDGHRVTLSRAERIEAVRILTERGETLNGIAATLHIHQAQVSRDRRTLTEMEN